MKKIVFTDNEILKIKDDYLVKKLSCKEIGNKYNVSKQPINRVLKELGVLRDGNSNGKKIILDFEQTEKIKKMYLEDNKNIIQIAKKLNLNKSLVDKILQNSDYRRSKSDAMKIIKTGVLLSDTVKNNMKMAQLKINLNGRKKIKGGICKFYKIKGLTCQGTFEKFYIEKLINENQKLPNNCDPILTPFGLYYPDFILNGKYIEIKSDYTFNILIGKIRNHFTGDFDKKQLEKIKYVTENIGNVDVIVVDKKNNKLIKKEI
jgi:predicted DNA-binding protein YlxM (UPF0122 family)